MRRIDTAGRDGPMNMPLTLALTLGFAGFAAFCGWRGAREPDFAKGPRMVPWRMLMLLSAAGALLFLTHLVNLAGFETGGQR